MSDYTSNPVSGSVSSTAVMEPRSGLVTGQVYRWDGVNVGTWLLHYIILQNITLSISTLIIVTLIIADLFHSKYKHSQNIHMNKI